MNLTSADKNKDKKSKQTNISQYDANVAIAFQSDCEEFLEKFAEYRNCKFTTFTQLWKEVNFLQILRYHEKILALKTFLENCFFITKKFLFSEDLYIQTGALYVLFALYYKQPIKKCVKIRLTKTESDKLKEIVEIHKAHNPYDDVIFVYNKMRIDEVFQYCALSLPVGLETRCLRRFDINDDVTVRSRKKCALNKFKRLMEVDPDLVQFEETDEEYQKLAHKYKEKYGKLFVFPSKICDDLKKAYSEIFHVNLEDQPGAGQEHIIETKTRAMTNTNATYRGERKMITALDLNEASTSKHDFT